MNTSDLKFDRKRSRVKTCPCGKSNRDGKFVPYTGFEDKGFCHACGETFLPEAEKKPERIEIPKAAPPSFISHDSFKKSLTQYETNAFAQFLIATFGDITLKVIAKYFIGTTRTGGTVFWQIDTLGKVRSGKIIQYNQQTGKRIQDKTPDWVHSKLNLVDFNLVQCLFGEHLLKGNNKPCAIVESEKTACIASIYFPDLIWIACGGKDGLKASKLQILKGRKVILFPDLDGFTLWTQKAEELKPMLDVRVSDLLDKKATESERLGKLDIADYLLRFKPEQFNQPLIETLKGQQIPMNPAGYPLSWTPKDKLEALIQKNPAIAELIKKFELIPLN